MSADPEKPNSFRLLKISDETRKAYVNRDKSLDSKDPDSPTLSPEAWAGAVVAEANSTLRALSAARKAAACRRLNVAETDWGRRIQRFKPVASKQGWPKLLYGFDPLENGGGDAGLGQGSVRASKQVLSG